MSSQTAISKAGQYAEAASWITHARWRSEEGLQLTCISAGELGACISSAKTLVPALTTLLSPLPAHMIRLQIPLQSEEDEVHYLLQDEAVMVAELAKNPNAHFRLIHWACWGRMTRAMAAQR